ncbi:uncharacterized protein C2845_PM07G16470 [Panicum miliaceum]|uniref:CCHC-type domain-containing protein n=1 Tax=Panicum miliaceum TaxID=4540 RepID=A0A3L6SSD8_PANMI|nr:uncharacterized protein C2845_PM07G16470 [Panicum miliaceum]
MRRIIINGLRPEYSGFMAEVSGWPIQPSLVELENLLANQKALAKRMGSITLEKKDKEEALFIRKKGPPKDRGEAKEWTRGDTYCLKKNNYSRGAQNDNDDEDDHELVKNERRRRGECFNCGKMGHFIRDCPSLRKHTEGNVATMKKVVHSGWLSEEEWDAEACIITKDDEVYFVEDLTEGEALLARVAEEEEEEEEEDDAEAGLSMEIRDPNISTGFIVFKCDEELQEYGEDKYGALVVHEDLEEHDKMKKIPEGCNCEKLRYDNISLAVIMPSYKDPSRGKTTRRVKKKEKMHGCIKFAGNLRRKIEAYELKEEKIMSRGQVKKKVRNDRAQNIQWQRHRMVWPPETSIH